MLLVGVSFVLLFVFFVCVLLLCLFRCSLFVHLCCVMIIAFDRLLYVAIFVYYGVCVVVLVCCFCLFVVLLCVLLCFCVFCWLVVYLRLCLFVCLLFL